MAGLYRVDPTAEVVLRVVRHDGPEQQPVERRGSRDKQLRPRELLRRAVVRELQDRVVLLERVPI